VKNTTAFYNITFVDQQTRKLNIVSLHWS